MEDRIDDALEFFQEYHFDGTEKTFLKHQITGSSTLKLTSNVSTWTSGETITGGTSGVEQQSMSIIVPIQQYDIKIQK